MPSRTFLLAPLVAQLTLWALTPALPAQTPVPRPGADPAHSPGAGPTDARTEAPADDLPERDRVWDALLRAHVRAGEVDYAALAAAPARLDRYLTSLRDLDPDGLDRDETLALWVNAYNAFTLRLILDHWTVDGPTINGIKDIPNSKRWDDRRWNVGGQLYSLDQIEHELLRPLGEPRVHFVLVCASRSCPDLPGEALTAARLDAQLDGATRHFLADTTKGLAVGDEPGMLWGTNHVVRLSKLFDWFEEDFGDSEQAVLDFVLPYAPPAAADYIRTHRDDLHIESFSYDWTLNRAR